jgi:hypothetical protein
MSENRESWEIDKPIWVRDSLSEKWQPRHYAGESGDNKCLAWIDGTTSHTNHNPVDECTTIWLYAVSDEAYKRLGEG